ncbi:MAG TPA: nucleoside monophosphate kinase [Opitutus sp.]|nr:nucleoside monophosphate kinase [Opitutus sp.]
MSVTTDRTAWIEGGCTVCPHPPAKVHRAWHLVLLGPPGVGKGTQAELLAQTLGACPLSTGEVFRAARHHPVAPGSAMAAAQAQMQRGELVTDETVLDLVRERTRCLHCSGGFMLDGFPRTLAQATALDALLARESLTLDAVISYDLPAAQLIARLSGRRVCPKCKAVFHVTAHPPRAAGVCDQCGTALVQRPDDNATAVAVRLDAYAAATAPLAQHYRAQGLLVPIVADGEPARIFSRTLEALAARSVPV